ncbi:MAG: type VI secretion system ATPase TssH, partial [Myxococcota bacterium]
REQVMGELRRHFRPEFLNRLDDVVLFKPLQLAQIRSIVDLLIERLQRRLQDRQLTLELSPEARDWIAEQGYDPVYGARPLKRFLQRGLETRIGRRMIAGDVPDGSTLVVTLVDGALDVAVGPILTG